MGAAETILLPVPTWVRGFFESLSGRMSTFGRKWDIATIAAILMLALGAVQLVAGALEVGVTTDEQSHTERLDAWLDDGWYVPGRLQVDGRPDPVNPESTPYVYGPAFSLLGHLANVLAGNEPVGGVSHSADAYAVRHLIVALIAALAVAAVGAAAWLICDSRRIGLWTAAGLLAMPQWSGQAFFNVKDVPAAAGYTLVTVALIFALVGAVETSPGRRRQLLVAAMLAFGIWIGAGTRTSLWAPMLVSICGYAALRIGQLRFGGARRFTGSDLAVAVGTVAGAFAIAAIYPNAVRTPRTFLTQSVSTSSHYPWEGFTLTAGHLLPEHPPWWYLPAWLGGTMPLLLGLLALSGLGVTVWVVVGLVRSRGERRRTWRDRRLGLTLAAAQLLTLPVATAVNGSVMYNGLRQHLYLLPAAAILAGAGAAAAWSWAGRRAPSTAPRTLVGATLALALLVPAVEQGILFPYDYAYVNPIARLGGVNDRWETDYWFASAPEALSRVPRGVELRCSNTLVPGWEPDAAATFGPCAGDQFEPYEDLRGTDLAALSAGSLDRHGVWAIAKRLGGNQPPPYCEEVGDVTRWLSGEEVVMSYVLLCDPRRVNGQ